MTAQELAELYFEWDALENTAFSDTVHKARLQAYRAFTDAAAKAAGVSSAPVGRTAARARLVTKGAWPPGEETR